MLKGGHQVALQFKRGMKETLGDAQEDALVDSDASLLQLFVNCKFMSV